MGKAVMKLTDAKHYLGWYDESGPEMANSRIRLHGARKGHKLPLPSPSFPETSYVKVSDDSDRRPTPNATWGKESPRKHQPYPLTP